MSKVTYKIGNNSYCYKTKLQYDLFATEEKLLEDIKVHKSQLKQQPEGGYIHDVVFVDDNGIVSTAKDLSRIGNLELRRMNDEK